MKRNRPLLFCFVALLFWSSSASGQMLETMFYMVDDEQCFQSFRENIKHIDIVGPQSYRMDEDGILWGTVDPRIIDLAGKAKVKVMPLVMNPGFDQQMLHKLLQNPEAQERAVRSMLAVCVENKFYGIQFDFENIHISDKDAFTAFYKKTADALHRNGYAISIAVVPRASDDPGETGYHKWIFEYWRGAYDYKALAEVSDFISYMTYEQHSRRTPPGPVAGYTWMEACLKFVLRDVPSEKISLGIPFYSNYWHPFAEGERIQAWGRSFDYAEAIGRAERFGAVLKWDDREKVSIAVYENDGLYEYIFIEDARAFRAKLALARKHKVRGISVWRLGHEDPAVWKELGR